MNNEINRAIVFSEGWLKGIRRFTFQASGVSSEQNNEAANPSNPNPPPVSIPTVSSNVDALENGGHAHDENIVEPVTVGNTPVQSESETHVMVHTQEERNIDQLDTNPNLHAAAIRLGILDNTDVEGDNDIIETIHLETVRETRRQKRLINKRIHKNAWME